jgi:5-hydroxyisourate hydrolase-like protein (transthyretin family)
MHNWEHYGRLPAYFLAATLVASCGGDGDGILGNITGVSDAQVTLTAASGSKLTKQGEMTVQVRLLDASSNPLANKSLTLSSSSSNVVLSPTTVVTSATGLATFVIKGNITGELTAANSSGQVTATYTDEKGDIKTHKIAYTIVDVSELVSSYKLDACFVLTANPCASSVTLKTVGSESLADAQFILKDSAGQPLANKKVNFSLLKPTGSGSLQATSATTDSSGKVTVNVQAGSDASSNSVIASVTDANGIETTSALSFEAIVGNRVSFVADKSEILSGGDSVDLSAIVVAASGNVQANVPVTFSLVKEEAGVSLKGSTLVTDSNGKAKVTLELTNAEGADLSNHAIQVIASIGSGSSYSEKAVNVKVVGTSIEATTPNSSVEIGATPTITAVLKNGKGQSIANQKLMFTSEELKDNSTGAFLDKEVVTDSSGKVVLSTFKVLENDKLIDKQLLSVDKSTDGKAKVNVSGLGTNTILEFDVSERNFDLSFVNAKNEPVIEEEGLIFVRVAVLH